MDDSFKKAVRAVSDAFSTKQNVIEWKPATLGDGHGTVSTGNNMVYCRLSDNSSVIEVLNLRVQPVDGLRVRIGKLPEMPLVWQVLGQDDQRVDENGQDSGGGGVYNTPLHHRTHEYLGSDQVNLDWRQITTLRVYAYSGFSIGVLAGLIPRTGGDLVVATQTLDLSSHVPASGALYCLITVDASGLLDTTDGTTIDSLANLALTDIPDTPAGHFRLAAIRLYAGQSAINESRNSNDVRDLRWPQENVAGSAGALFGTQTANTIFAGPASGAAALPTFRSGVTDDIASGVFPLARGGTNADNATDAINNLLPSQSGQAGNVLTTDGANVSWGAGGGGSGSITIASLPVGTIAAFGGSSIPSGWLECNGAAVSRTTYSDLFTAIGTTYGVGDGSTTFNLPDLRGRTSIGKGTGSGLSARTIGATGGEETHTLTTTEIPSHTHSIPSRDATAGGAHADTVPSVTSTGLDTTTYTNVAGSGGAHNNMQPFLVTAWIIKYTDTATSAIIFNDTEGDPADVTLARADGTSIYAARRDHAHAIDVSIAPTWTGAHTHTQSLTVRGDGAAPGFANTLYWTSAQGPAFAGYRARGSLASPAAVQNTDILARFSGRGYDGSTFEVTAPARMDVVASETHGASAAGTRIEFYTTPNASTTIGLAATIGQDKSLSVIGALSASNYSGTVSGGGTLATGGFTLTVPATGTAALLGTANVFTALQTVTLTDTTTNTESNIAVLNHNSSNTTAAGFGSTLRFNLKFNNANDTAAAGLTAYWSGTSISRVRIDADSGTGSLSEALTVGTNYFKALSAAPIFGAYTLTIPATGTATLGTGTTNQVAYWSGTNTVASSANLTFDTSTLTLSNVAFYSQANGANPATFYGYSAVAGQYPYFDFRRARGSIGSPSAVNTGDILGAVNFYGRVTGGDANAASIICATAFSTGSAITPYLVFSVFAPTQNDILYCYSTGAYINTGKFLTVGGFTTPTSGFSLRSDTPAEFTANDAATSTVTTIAAIRHNSTGTPTTGFGAAQLFTLESSTTADTSAANIKVSWSDATHATRKAKAVVNVYDTAERSAITFEADGAAADAYFEGGDGSGLPYGSCYGNEIGWAQAAAAQNTWYIISDADMTDATGGLNLVTHDGSGKLTVTKAGHYLVNYSVTMECSVLNKHVQTGISINGTVINDAIQHYEVSTPNAQLTIGSTAVVKLAASGYIEIAVRTTDTGTPDLSVDHLNFSIVQIGG